MAVLPGNLRHALRALRRAPGFTAVAVGTLALGIGATTAIFTVVNGVLLRPMPYEAPERLAIIWNDLGEGAQSLPAVSALDFLDYRERSRTFEAFAAASGPSVARLRGNLTGEGDPERVDLAPVTANFFPLLGVTPALGRGFTAAEELPNGPRVAILSHRLWRRRYAGDPGIVGRSVAIDGIEHLVVGVLPEEFRLLLPAEAFLSPTPRCGPRCNTTTAARRPAISPASRSSAGWPRDAPGTRRRRRWTASRRSFGRSTRCTRGPTFASGRCRCITTW